MSRIEIFFRDCLGALKRIASQSNGEASLDDVMQETWLIANDLAVAGHPMDLASPVDQDSMLGKLYGRFVLRMRTCIGLALRLDKNWDLDDDEAGPRLSDRLRADELSNPLKLLEKREEPDIDELALARRRSYSQATAYAICLARWQSAASLATYLCIALGTLNTRLRHWRAWVERQPSLFDGVEQIAEDFRPLPGVLPAPEIAVRYDGEQQAWEF
jgi:hypothetical protein